MAEAAWHFSRRLLTDDGAIAPDHGVVVTPPRRDTTWLKAGVFGLLLVAGLALAVTVPLPEVDVVRGWLRDGGPPGWAALVAGVALVLICPVPRTAVGMLIGLVVGFVPGVLVAYSASMIASVLAFGLARWLGRSAVTRLAGPRLARLDGAVTDRGFVAVLIARLMPVVPFVVLSYGAGLTGMRLAPYVAATALGIVPSAIVQVAVGASASILVTGAAAAVVLPVVVLAGTAFLWVRRRNGGISPA